MAYHLPPAIRTRANALWAAIAFLAVLVAVGVSLSDTKTRVETRIQPIERIVKGKPGAPGAAGKTVRQLATDPGRNGARGEHGVLGTRGLTGGLGPLGRAGPSGAAGPAGSSGQQGAAGSTGAQGDTGEAGPTGPPPRSFSFTINGVTYTCNDPDGDGNSGICDPHGP